jgi:putative oxidoreductase
MNTVSNPLYPVGRALIGVLFVVSGLNKLFAYSYVAGWMASMGVPLAPVLLAAAILLEVGGGLSLITGIQARLGAAALGLFLIPVTAIFHAFWSADAANFQNQLNHFLKNVAIFGSMLVVLGAELQRKAASRNGKVVLAGGTA